MDWLLERTVVSALFWEMKILQQWNKIIEFNINNFFAKKLTGWIRWQRPVGSLLYCACIFISKRQRIWLSAWAWLLTKDESHISKNLIFFSLPVAYLKTGVRAVSILLHGKAADEFSLVHVPALVRLLLPVSGQRQGLQLLPGCRHARRLPLAHHSVLHSLAYEKKQISTTDQGVVWDLAYQVWGTVWAATVEVVSDTNCQTAQNISHAQSTLWAGFCRTVVEVLIWFLVCWTAHWAEASSP